ncbi:COX15-CtaA-domain-containing protein [Metschnikowia bicuspidata var. bicuspidata NRRL YB-4993]|uniref:COX15-CtaA-domain-containing protein n=1 Tax=Metschnikowia bicuspidata var. bicuspidata NRRL YB-4993 TaxID=869754 RepID=A0A1A0HCP0_9ASCO|nr:COX15-CtaA-domain-containing protein [Metschnikowia bicuspidata var. bicuspidata NRRL YB-4993]OBA21755.1 COX15-CtaA-domain-containing protein [Metschnikowia bicuspidata var. bicuspidata NRRL YB-4993]
MFCRSGFYFTRNMSVLKIMTKASGSRLNIVREKTTPLTRIVLSLRVSRPYSSYLHTNPISTKIGVKESASKLVKNGYPVISSKAAGYWLVCTSGLIFGIVVVGGLTRLTESGLSITEWKPVTGTIPPLNEVEWQEEFQKYQESPEFKQLNSHITLDEFKFIFSMEWGHRFLGRCIGMFFIVPAVYFWKTGRFSALVSKRVVGLTGLLGLQGAIGWWMVKSGLDEEQLSERKSKPTVSQYRLTTHLGAAFLMYLGVLWTAFEILNENRWVKGMKADPKKVTDALAMLNSNALNKTRSMGLGLIVLTYLTAMSGGMVAGLDAGLIYNTFPHMGDEWLPSHGELMSPVFSRNDDHSDLWWRNLFENPTTVQLVHRILATSTFFAIFAGHMYVNKNKAVIPARAKRTFHAVMGLVTLQVTLGISTLIYLVPIPLAAAHQAGALALLTGCLAFAANVKRPRPQTVNYISSIMKQKLLKNH